MYRILIIVSLSLFYSCATKTPGTKLDSTHNSLSSTIKVIEDFTGNGITMLQLSLENTSRDWIEVESVYLDGDKMEGLSVLVGHKLNGWIDACLLDKQVSDYNTSLLIGALALGGTAVMAGSNNQSTSKTGALVALGAIGYSAVRDFSESKNRAELIDFQNGLPDNHLLKSFAIPPYKVVQRFIVIEAENNFKGEQINFNFKTKSQKEPIVVKFPL